MPPRNRGLSFCKIGGRRATPAPSFPTPYKNHRNPLLPNGIISKSKSSFLCISPFVPQNSIIHIISIDENLKKW